MTLARWVPIADAKTGPKATRRDAEIRLLSQLRPVGDLLTLERTKPSTQATNLI